MWTAWTTRFIDEFCGGRDGVLGWARPDTLAERIDAEHRRIETDVARLDDDLDERRRAASLAERRVRSAHRRGDEYALRRAASELARARTNIERGERILHRTEDLRALVDELRHADTAATTLRFYVSASASASPVATRALVERAAFLNARAAESRQQIDAFFASTTADVVEEPAQTSADVNSVLRSLQLAPLQQQPTSASMALPRVPTHEPLADRGSSKKSTTPSK